MRDSELHIENKRELSVANAWNYMRDTAQKKHILGGGTAHTFLIGGTKTYAAKPIRALVVF